MLRKATPAPLQPASATSPLTRLADLPDRTPAWIVDVRTPDVVRERLLDLGFVPGTAIERVRRAPLGDPSAYALRGVHVCLRRTEAEEILVQVQPDPEP